MKKKGIMLIVMLLIGTIINVYVVGNIGMMMEGEEVVGLNIINNIRVIKGNILREQIFMLLEVVVIMLSVLTLLIDRNTYRSELEKITEDIYTPKRSGQNQYGSARWMKEKEKEEYFNKVEIDVKDKKSDIKTGGLVLGKEGKGNKKVEKIYYNGEDTHTLCIGATRSGKTRTTVLQSIGLIGLSGESMVISDPKGELYNYTSEYLKNLGYEVIGLDFKNPKKSSKFNFLEGVIEAIDRDDIPKAIERIWDLTESLVPQNSSKEKIWANGEASIIASAIMCVCYDNRAEEMRKYRNMTNVFYFISEMCKSEEEEIPLSRYMKELEDDHPARGLLAISEIAPEETRGSFFTSALTTLRLFTNPLIWSMTNETEFNIKDIGKKKVAMYIILPDEKTTYYSLASLVVNQIYVELVEEADNRGGED